jgi:hypothetical protein
MGLAAVRQHYQLALIAMLGLLIHSAGFCVASLPNCVLAQCDAAHEPDDSCHEHNRHSGSCSTYECCQSAVCRSGVETAADGRGSSSHRLTLLPIAFDPRSIDLKRSLSKFSAGSTSRPPPEVPIFLSLRTLLI